MKTNAVRILESSKIDFRTFEYSFDEEGLDAITVANKINAEPEQVFKTLVSKSDSGYFVFCIPGNYELNLKKAATASSVKKIEMLPLKELTNVTGYVRGGCSPIGMKKLFPTFIDETALLFDKIYVSAGIRGMQLFLKPTDLANIIDAKFADLI
ncbi:MAG TPA: Cys-tRNA(Pro) deacylase [Melioribacteraceae bacterium]|nr:Cys-tRNA(Pro) deacylase [Melioribacteraceae bacterium]